MESREKLILGNGHFQIIITHKVATPFILVSYYTFPVNVQYAYAIRHSSFIRKRPTLPSLYHNHPYFMDFAHLFLNLIYPFSIIAKVLTFSRPFSNFMYFGNSYQSPLFELTLYNSLSRNQLFSNDMDS